MSDAFINYARADQQLASRLAAALISQGLTVWWDRELVAGASFLEAIQDAMSQASCIITLWTEDSIRSEWVRAEATFAMEHDKLLPVAIGERLDIPLRFRSIQTELVRPSQVPENDWLERLGKMVRDITLRERRTPRFLNEVTRTRIGEQPPRAHSPSTESGPAESAADVTPADVGRKAFISYADEDEQIAIDLVKHLESSGCSCWISFRDVDPGEDYRLSITKAINEVIFLVLVYSQHVNTSFDIATELLLARKRGKKRFVLRTDDTEPAGPVEYELATVQWVDCRSDRLAAFDRIAQRSALLG
jgi:hypothetical protein